LWALRGTGGSSRKILAVAVCVNLCSGLPALGAMFLIE
jgi:hypothetical protein